MVHVFSPDFAIKTVQLIVVIRDIMSRNGRRRADHGEVNLSFTSNGNPAESLGRPVDSGRMVKNAFRFEKQPA